MGKTDRIKSQLVTLVCGVIAASSNLIWVQSTKETFSPNSDATLLKYLLVPEAEHSQILKIISREHDVRKCPLSADLSTPKMKTTL